jgi:hypothetical protein
MRGVVYKINARVGMVAVETEEDFSVFEIISSDEVEVGDEISWKEHRPLGRSEIINHTSGERFEVYFQNHWVTKSSLNQQLLIR